MNIFMRQVAEASVCACAIHSAVRFKGEYHYVKLTQLERSSLANLHERTLVAAFDKDVTSCEL